MKICSVCQRNYDDSVEFCAENHGSLVPTRSVLTNRLIGNYQLDVLLECDAAGETYRATNSALEQPFVVKIINSNVAGDAENKGEKLLNEARAVATVNHPHLARVYESGALENGDFYVVGESLPGHTLREHLRRVGTLSETEAVTAARQAAEALAAAHAVGVVHRAVSPSNIVLDTDAANGLSIKLDNFDFGAANERIAAFKISEPHPPIDLLRYLSPEQCAREAVDARTDVYALGVVLYEMLCGRSPFDAPTLPSIVEKQINEQPLSRLRYDVRALLMYLLKQSLQNNPATRLPSAANFARQLRQIEQLVQPPMGIRMTAAAAQTAAPKKDVFDAVAFPVSASAPVINESATENAEPQEIQASENFAAENRLPENQIFAAASVEESEVNTDSENDFSSEPQPLFAERENVGSESLEAEEIFVEGEERSGFEQEETSVSASEFQPIAYLTDGQDEAFSGESVPFVVKIPNNSESLLIEKEERAELIAAEATDSSAASPAGIKMSEAPTSAGVEMPEARKSAGVKMRGTQKPAGVKMRATAASIHPGVYVPSRASRLFAPKQIPMLIVAALFTVTALGGLYLFWNSQQQKDLRYGQAAVAKETPIPTPTLLPRLTPAEASGDVAASVETDAAETEESVPIRAEESSVTVAKSETPNQPRRPEEASVNQDEAPQPDETVRVQPAREKPAAIERGNVSSSNSNNESAVKPATGDEQAKLNSSLDRWISATNARNVDQQMSYYAPKMNAYYRTRNASPESVRAEKKRVFERANAIDIKTGKPEITVSRDGQSATMRFRKKYAIQEGQKNRTGEVLQELRWVKSGNDWKIVSERDVKVINR